MHDYRYLAVLTEAPNGGMIATFPDVPEAITFGGDRADALRSAAEASGLALRGYLADGRSLPAAAASEGEMVSPYADDLLKIALVEGFRQSTISLDELRRLSGMKPWEAEALVDPDHVNGIAEMQNALAILGRRLHLSVDAA